MRVITMGAPEGQFGMSVNQCAACEALPPLRTENGTEYCQVEHTWHHGYCTDPRHGGAG